MKAFLRLSMCMFLVWAVFTCGGCRIEGVQLNQKAQYYMKHGRYDGAIGLLKKSLDVDYENSPSHYWLGRCYETKGEKGKALWEYELAVRFDPSMELAQMAYVKGLYRDGQKEKSVEAIKGFFKHKEAPSRYFVRLAEEFMAQQMEGHGIAAYQAAAKAEPGNPEPIIFLADYFFQKGDQDKGIDYLIRAFKLDPIYPGLAGRLGRLGLKVEIPQPKLFGQTKPFEQDFYDLGD